MAGEIQIGGTTFATESDGTVTIANVDSATNRQNLGLEIGVDVQQHDADTTKNDVANTFTANQIISVTDNTNAALRVTQLGTGNAIVVEDSTNPDSTPFVVDASGNVGIGTSSPTQRLQVDGGAFRITGDYTTIANNQGLLLGFDSASDEAGYYAIGANGGGVGEHVFYSYNYSTGSGSERMRIDSTGNLLVNTIDEIRNANDLGVSIEPEGRIYLGRGASSGGFAHLVFINSYGQVGSVVTAGASTSYNTSSDYRLKENITEITDGITRVKQLNPSRFNFIADPDKIVNGFIAHEVQGIVPEAVSGEKDAIDSDGKPEYQGVDYGRITPLLTAALKEAIAKIEMLETRIAVLEAK